jgi:hypothetical protein
VIQTRPRSRLPNRRSPLVQGCLLVAKVLGVTRVDVDSNDPADKSILGEDVVFKEDPICIPPRTSGDVRTAGPEWGLFPRRP